MLEAILLPCPFCGLSLEPWGSDAMHHPGAADCPLDDHASQGKPVGTEILLTLCHWMQVDPLHFAFDTPNRSNQHG
jgi:hypothetical protein